MTLLRKRGLSTLVICSSPFEGLGRTQARTFGVPNLPFVVTSHPLGGIVLDTVRARAAEAIPQILDLLRKRDK